MNKTRICLFITLVCISLSCLCFGVLSARSRYSFGGVINYENPRTSPIIQTETRVYGVPMYTKEVLSSMTDFSGITSGIEKYSKSTFSTIEAETVSSTSTTLAYTKRSTTTKKYYSNNKTETGSVTINYGDNTTSSTSTYNVYLVVINIKNYSETEKLNAYVDYSSIGTTSIYTNDYQWNILSTENTNDENSRNIVFMLILSDTTLTVTTSTFSYRLFLGENQIVAKINISTFKSGEDLFKEMTCFNEELITHFIENAAVSSVYETEVIGSSAITLGEETALCYLSDFTDSQKKYEESFEINYTDTITVTEDNKTEEQNCLSYYVRIQITNISDSEINAWAKDTTNRTDTTCLSNVYQNSISPNETQTIVLGYTLSTTYIDTLLCNEKINLNALSIPTDNIPSAFTASYDLVISENQYELEPEKQLLKDETNKYYYVNLGTTLQNSGRQIRWKLVSLDGGETAYTYDADNAPDLTKYKGSAMFVQETLLIDCNNTNMFDEWQSDNSTEVVDYYSSDIRTKIAGGSYYGLTESDYSDFIQPRTLGDLTKVDTSNNGSLTTETVSAPTDDSTKDYFWLCSYEESMKLLNGDKVKQFWTGMKDSTGAITSSEAILVWNSIKLLGKVTIVYDEDSDSNKVTIVNSNYIYIMLANNFWLRNPTTASNRGVVLSSLGVPATLKDEQSFVRSGFILSENAVIN